MENIDTIKDDGFKFDKKGNDNINLALISLKIALKAYFSTYQTFKNRLYIFEPSGCSEDDIDSWHSDNYCEAYLECIVHFQHFAELVLKEFLRKDNLLLTVRLTDDSKILHKIVHGQSLKDEEEAKLKSIEFKDTLNHITALINNNILEDYESLGFIVKNHNALEALNWLRNRLLHRGLFILRYKALDKFVGAHILPFVSEVIKHSVYSNYKLRWKYSDLNCTIDPIDEIISEFKKGSKGDYNIGKIAYLKELGRAAFENPIISHRVKPRQQPKDAWFNIKKKERAERIASLEAEQEYFDVDICPVCGVNSLVIYEEKDHDDSEHINMNYYTYMVKCECCSFELNTELKNASYYEISSINDFWVTK